MSDPKRSKNAGPSPLYGLPPRPKNEHVGGLASFVFSSLGMESPTIKQFYKSKAPVLSQFAGPVSSAEFGVQESQYVQQHGDASNPADQLAMQVPTPARAVAASVVGTGLSVMHKQMEMSHPDTDPTQFGGT